MINKNQKMNINNETMLNDDEYPLFTELFLLIPDTRRCDNSQQTGRTDKLEVNKQNLKVKIEK